MSVTTVMSEQDSFQEIAATVMALLEDACVIAAWIQDPDLSLSEVSEGYEALQDSVDVAQAMMNKANQLLECH